MKYTMKPTTATNATYPELLARTAAPSASSVPPLVVVPFSSVPFSTIVLVPLTSTTLTKLKFRLE